MFVNKPQYNIAQIPGHVKKNTRDLSEPTLVKDNLLEIILFQNIPFFIQNQKIKCYTVCPSKSQCLSGVFYRYHRDNNP